MKMENPFNREEPMWFCGLINDGFGCNEKSITCKECLKDLLKEIKEYLEKDNS